MKTRCDAVSYAQMPSNPVTTTYTGVTYSDRKKCEKNEGSCVKKYGKWTGISTSTTDTNSSGRDAVFKDCMYSYGWRAE